MCPWGPGSPTRVRTGRPLLLVDDETFVGHEDPGWTEQIWTCGRVGASNSPLIPRGVGSSVTSRAGGGAGGRSGGPSRNRLTWVHGAPSRQETGLRSR